MDHARAKEILSANHDATAGDPLGPEVAEALELANNDPELRLWLERIQHLRPGPAGALDRGATEPAAGRQIPKEPAPQSYKRRRILLSLAAATVVVLAAGTLYLVFPAKVEFPGESFNSAATFRNHMALFANSRFYLDHNTPNLSSAREWLDERGFPSFSEIPARIAQFKGMGSKMIDWGGHKVGMVCFSNERGEIVYLFVITRGALEDLDTLQSPFESLVVQRGLETGGWLDRDNAYLLVGSQPGIEIGMLLGAN